MNSDINSEIYWFDSCLNQLLAPNKFRLDYLLNEKINILLLCIYVCRENQFNFSPDLSVCTISLHNYRRPDPEIGYALSIGPSSDEDWTI